MSIEVEMMKREIHRLEHPEEEESETDQRNEVMRAMKQESLKNRIRVRLKSMTDFFETAELDK